MKDGPVGYIYKKAPELATVCLEHGDPNIDVPIWHVNIWQYGANCYVCGIRIVEGLPGWPNLYEPRKPETETSHE